MMEEWLCEEVCFDFISLRGKKKQTWFHLLNPKERNKIAVVRKHVEEVWINRLMWEKADTFAQN